MWRKLVMFDAAAYQCVNCAKARPVNCRGNMDMTKSINWLKKVRQRRERTGWIGLTTNLAPNLMVPFVTDPLCVGGTLKCLGLEESLLKPRWLSSEVPCKDRKSRMKQDETVIYSYYMLLHVITCYILHWTFEKSTKSEAKLWTPDSYTPYYILLLLLYVYYIPVCFNLPTWRFCKDSTGGGLKIAIEFFTSNCLGCTECYR